MKTQLLGALLALSITAPAFAAIKETPVTYNDGQTTMKGFVVYDTPTRASVRGSSWCTNGGASRSTCTTRRAEVRAAGLHGFHRRHVRRRQDGRQPEGRGRALGLGDEESEGDGIALQRRARASSPNSRRSIRTRIGAVGYCFGGAVVLNMARAGADLAGVVGFHASLGLNTPAPAAGTVKAKILVLNGADDPFVKKEEYETLKSRHGRGEGRLPGDRISRARCTPSRTPRRPRSARSSICRSATTQR